MGVFKMTSIIGKKPSKNIPLKKPFKEDASNIKRILPIMLGKMSKQLKVMSGWTTARIHAVLIKSSLLPVMCVNAMPEILEKNANMETGRLKLEAIKQERDKIMQETIAILFDFSM